VAQYYLENINNPEIVLPKVINSEGHVWHLFVIRTSKREELINYMNDNGIQTLIHYPIPPHKQEAFKIYNSLSFPITEKIHNEVLSLPNGPILGNDEVINIVKILNEFSI